MTQESVEIAPGPGDLAVRYSPILIIGSGFSGLGAAIKLDRAGHHDFLVLERADDVGGTWRDNTYPGAACDVPLYFSAPAPISTRFFPVLFPKYQRVYRSYDNGETWSDCSRISLNRASTGWIHANGSSSAAASSPRMAPSFSDFAAALDSASRSAATTQKPGRSTTFLAPTCSATTTSCRWDWSIRTM